MIRLHVNVDHVATLRQARGTAYPDPLEAARACERAGAKGITVQQGQHATAYRYAEITEARLVREDGMLVLRFTARGQSKRAPLSPRIDRDALIAFLQRHGLALDSATV